jgi:hypothetical protein
MSDVQRTERILEDIAALMAERLELRPAPFARLVEKARPLLPRRLKRHAQVLAEAQGAAVHPRLALTLDQAQVARSAAALRDYLSGIDVADRRLGRRLSLLGSLAMNLILVAMLLLVVLVWRGFL